MAENRAFIYMARHFASKGLPVPEVLEVSDDEMAYIQTDLGDTLLFKEIEKRSAHPLLFHRRAYSSAMTTKVQKLLCGP